MGRQKTNLTVDAIDQLEPGASLECVRPAATRDLAPSAPYANFSDTTAFDPGRSRRKRDPNPSNFQD